MAQGSRLTGNVIDMFNLAGTEYVASIADATIRIESDVANDRALKDIWDFNIITHGRWSVDFACLYDTAVGPALIDAVIAGTTLAVIIENGPGTSAERYTGNAVLQSVDHTFPDNDIQRLNFRLVGRGAIARVDSQA